MDSKVYRRGITTTSTTLSDLGEIGDERILSDKKYRLVYTAVTLSTKEVLALDSGDASLTSWRVQIAPVSTTPSFGVNDTGASMATGTYFWAMTEGPYVVDSTVLGTDVTVAAETPLMLNSDARITGLIGVATTAHTLPTIGMSLVSIDSDATDHGTPTIIFKPGMSG